MKQRILDGNLDQMSNRLGIRSQGFQYKNPKDVKAGPLPIKNNFLIDGLNDQDLRLGANGGFKQQGRMIFDKRRSLDRALLYSYQGANIKKISTVIEREDSMLVEVSAGERPKITRALINPDKNKMDYDDKMVSVHFEADYGPGDVFEWMGTNSYWLIYLQDMTELAYFRGAIRRCSYSINWIDENGNLQSSFAAVRGPVETKINYIQKHGISVDTPNHSLHILMPRSDDIVKYFQRYSKFYLKGCQEVAPKVCWRVEATDWISTPGIFELTAVEYYANETEDDLNAGLVGSLIAAPVNPNPEEVETYIKGDTFIKPKKTYIYKFNGERPIGTWKVEKDRPVRMVVDEDDPLTVYIMWDSSYSGEFELTYGSFVKKIVVESLF